MPVLAPPRSTDLGNELDCYLSADIEDVTTSIIAWWYKRRTLYPCLSWMAIDYLTIPGMSNSSLVAQSPVIYSEVIGSYFSGGGTSFQLWSASPLSYLFPFVLTVNTRLAVPWCLEPFEPRQDRRCIEGCCLARCSG
jgi:hypothetical protein